MGMKKYYILHRPVGIGTQPSGFADFANFGYRTYIPEIGREAWGWLKYDRELTEKELRDYELERG